MERQRDARHLSRQESTMTSEDEFTRLDDPAFLAERRRVREELQELIERYRRINEEFDRRARVTWATAGRQQ
jgi:hypothetical protein